MSGMNAIEEARKRLADRHALVPFGSREVVPSNSLDRGFKRPRMDESFAIVTGQNQNGHYAGMVPVESIAAACTSGSFADARHIKFSVKPKDGDEFAVSGDTRAVGHFVSTTLQYSGGQMSVNGTSYNQAVTSNQCLTRELGIVQSQLEEKTSENDALKGEVLTLTGKVKSLEARLEVADGKLATVKGLEMGLTRATDDLEQKDIQLGEVIACYDRFTASSKAQTSKLVTIINALRRGDIGALNGNMDPEIAALLEQP